jgi:predicted permease
MGIRRTFRLPIRSRGDIGRAVDEELAFHMEAAKEEWIQAGLSPEEARARAMAEFGDVEFTRAYCVEQGALNREGRGMRMEELFQDLRFAARTLRKAPGFSMVVILTLAVGIAANSVIFSIMNPYFLRPLPYGEPEELVQVGQIDEGGWIWGRFSLPQIEDWSQRSPAITDWASYWYRTGNVTGPEGPERIMYTSVTDNLFRTLDSGALLGRTIQPGDGGPAGEEVVVLSHALWQRRFAEDPGVIGRTLAIDGVQHSVIGVMPAEFNFPFGDAYMWVPDKGSAAGVREMGNYIPIGRLAEGWTAERAQADLLRVQQELSQVYPDVDGRFRGATVQPIRQALNFAWEPLRIGALVMQIAVGLVLLIACVNVAGLTLARARSRTREMAIRTAVGANRRRIVRQLVTESLLLALMGGVAGVAVTYQVTAFLDSILPPGLYKVGGVTLDARVLGFTLLVTLATPLLFGLLPALSSSRADLSVALREGGDRGGRGPTSMKSRRALVVAEVAVALVLITATGLFLRSFMALRDLDLGYDANRVLTMEITPPETEYESREEMEGYFSRALAEVEALPGVEAVGMAYPLVMNHENLGVSFARPDQEPAEDAGWNRALATWVDPGYFASMDIALLGGRGFELQDNRDGPMVVVVSENLARRVWPEGSPLGQTLLLDSESRQQATVVGVVGEVYHSGFDAQGADAHIYRPLSQTARRRRFITVRTAGPPADVVPAARQALLSVDPNLPVAYRPLSEVVGENDFPWRLGSIFLGIFGGVALFLSTLGIYGLISYSVSQRRKEIGVRVAMGATVREIHSVVVGEGMRLTALGIVLGLAAALVVARLAQAILFGVSPFDVITFGVVVATFLGVAFVATFIPARRAGRIDPATVLRAE